MPKAAKGFLTSDGRFFPTKAEAEFAEATTELRAAIKEMKINPDTFINVLEWHHVLIRRWTTIHAQILDIEEDKSRAAGAYTKPTIDPTTDPSEGDK